MILNKIDKLLEVHPNGRRKEGKRNVKLFKTRSILARINRGIKDNGEKGRQ